MATGNHVAYLYPADLTRENGPAQVIPLKLAGPAGVVAGDSTVAVVGAPLRKLDGDGYQAVVRLSHLASVGTGLTFLIYCVDDPNNSAAGLVANLGITVKRLVSGTDDLTLASAATEVTVTYTADATAGQFVTVSKAIAAAALPASLAAGDLILLRIRRLGTGATDTHTGTVLILGVSIIDT